MNKTTQEKIEVMRRYEQGEHLQATEVTNPHSSDWYTECHPSWDWMVFDYRIVPIPESKAEQEEKAEEGKHDDQSPNDHVRRCEQSEEYLAYKEWWEEMPQGIHPSAKDRQAAWFAAIEWERGRKVQPEAPNNVAPRLDRVPVMMRVYDADLKEHLFGPVIVEIDSLNPRDFKDQYEMLMETDKKCLENLREDMSVDIVEGMIRMRADHTDKSCPPAETAALLLEQGVVLIKELREENASLVKESQGLKQALLVAMGGIVKAIAAGVVSAGVLDKINAYLRSPPPPATTKI